MSNILPYVFIFALLVLSAFFSGSEIAYDSINRQRLKREAESGKAGARLAERIYEKYDEKGLTTILIGNTLVNLASSAIGTVIALRLVPGGRGTAIATAVMTVLIITFGEIMPKVIARRNTDFFVMGGAWFLTALGYLLYPFVKLFFFIVSLFSKLWKAEEDEEYTEQELVSIIETVEDEGIIDEDRGELLQSAIEFKDITVQEIITPRVDMVYIDITDTPEEIARELYDSPYSRVPVCDGGADNVIGILGLNRYFKAASDLDAEPDIRSLMLEPTFMHKSTRLPQALSEMKKRSSHMAVVTDEYGGTMGIVTMEDVLEQLVGEIWDETDEVEEEIRETEPGTFLISGDMSIYDMLDELELPEELYEGDFTTAGGWAIEMLKGYAKPGDSFTFGPLEVTVKETDELRITRLSVRKLSEEE